MYPDEPEVNIDVRGRHYYPPVENAQWVDAASGCATASFTVRDPNTVDVLTEDCPVYISDPHSGEHLWTGKVARNGLQLSPLGDSAKVRCVGNTEDAYSTYWSLPYLVRDYSEWERETIKYRSATNWDTQTGARPLDPPWDAVVISIGEGSNLYPGNGGRMAYMGHLSSDMYVGGITFNADCGTATHPDGSNTTPSYLQARLEVGDQFWGNFPYQRAFHTTADIRNERANGVGWPAPPNPHDSPPRDNTGNYLVLSTSFSDSAGHEVKNPNVWFAASQLVVMGQRVDRYGSNVYPALGSAPREALSQVFSREIVEDLVGRCLRDVVDPTLLHIDAADTWKLTQADYRSPVSPGEVLDDLLLTHPDHLWRMGLTSASSGLAPLEYRLWSTTPKYLVDESAEVDTDGAPDALYNRVTVRWIDWKGRPRSHSFDADPDQYPDIADLRGWHEPPPVELGPSLGEWAIVERVGLRYLDQVARRITTGTVTVTEHLLDVETQQRVPPSQITAGTTLAFTWDDPLVVHRVREVSHDGLQQATLSVGRPSLALDQIVDTHGLRRR